jgi:hypothetical protein
VLHATCEEILAGRDFRYARSGPHASRQAPPFVHRLGFQTSKLNRRDDFVELRIEVAVTSRPFAVWLQSHRAPLRQDSWIAGGDLGSFVPPGHETRAWNVADKQERTEAITEARAILSDQVEPFFAFFRDRDAPVSALAAGGIHGLPASRAVELLSWLDARDVAAAYVDWVLRGDASLSASFHHWLAAYRGEGLADPGADPADGKALAFVVVANDVPYA